MHGKRYRSGLVFLVLALWPALASKAMGDDPNKPPTAQTISGTVRWLGGRPDERAWFRIVAINEEGRVASRVRLSPDAKEFQFGELDPGKYSILCEEENIELLNNLGLGKISKVNALTSPTQNLQLLFRKRGVSPFKVRLIDAKTKTPIRRAKFSVSQKNSRAGHFRLLQPLQSFLIDEQGEYAIDVPIDGEFYVSIESEGYVDRWAIVHDSNHAPRQRRELSMRPAQAIEGRIVNNDGEPISGVTVEVLRYSFLEGPFQLHRSSDFLWTDVAESVATDDKGVFRLNRQASGMLNLRIQHPDYAKLILQQQLLNSGNRSDFVLSEGGAVTGQVFDDRGEPIANEEVVAMSGQRKHAFLEKRLTDKNGWYQFEKLPVGTALIERDDFGAGDAVTKRAVRVENRRSHQIDLGGTRKVYGQLFIDGEPHVNGRVVLAERDVMSQYTSTDEHGRFEFRGAPGGCWHLLKGLPPNPRLTDLSLLKRIDIPPRGDTDLGVLEFNSTAVSLTIEKTERDRFGEEPVVYRYDGEHGWPTRPMGNRRLKSILNEDGTATFKELFSGRHSFCLHEGHTRLWNAHVVLDGTARHIAIPMRVDTGTAEARLQLTDDDLPAKRAGWHLAQEEDERYSTSLHLNESGTATVKNLPAGRYSIRRGGFKERIYKTFMLQNGESKRVEFSYNNSIKNSDSWFELAVQTVDADGALVPTSPILINGRSRHRPRSHENATAVFAVTAGDYELRINQLGYREHREPLSIGGLDMILNGQCRISLQIELQAE